MTITSRLGSHQIPIRKLPFDGGGGFDGFTLQYLLLLLLATRFVWPLKPLGVLSDEAVNRFEGRERETGVKRWLLAFT